MSSVRFIERQGDVLAAATRLREAVALPASDIVRDAIIQRFEFTFEVVWKALKLFLEHQGRECAGPRPVLKTAFAEGLIPSEEEADVWMQMIDDRNLTSHAYDEALAARIHLSIVNDYAPVFDAMAARIQALKWE